MTEKSNLTVSKAIGKPRISFTLEITGMKKMV